MIGPEGYLLKAHVVPLLDWMEARGYKLFRPRLSASEFWSKTWETNVDYDYIDYLINEAKVRGVTIVLDVKHEFPPGTDDSRTAGNITGFHQRIARIGYRYNTKGNVVLEPFNEPNISNYATVCQNALNYLRSHGVTLPVLCTFYLPSRYAALNDSNVLVGTHRYFGGGSGRAGNFDAVGGSPTGSLNAYLALHPEIKSVVDGYFSPTGFEGKLRAKGIRMMCTEVGPTYNEGRVWSPSMGSMAAVMYYIRRCAEKGIDTGLYMLHGGTGTTIVSTTRKLMIYETLAKQMFNESYVGTYVGPSIPVCGEGYHYDSVLGHCVPDVAPPPPPPTQACILTALGSSALALEFFRAVRDHALPGCLIRAYYRISYGVLRNRGYGLSHYGV